MSHIRVFAHLKIYNQYVHFKARSTLSNRTEEAVHFAVKNISADTCLGYSARSTTRILYYSVDQNYTELDYSGTKLCTVCGVGFLVTGYNYVLCKRRGGFTI